MIQGGGPNAKVRKNDPHRMGQYSPHEGDESEWDFLASDQEMETNPGGAGGGGVSLSGL